MAKKRLKLVSWNVNGLRAVLKKDFFKLFKSMDADVMAIQEIKLQEPQLTDDKKKDTVVWEALHAYPLTMSDMESVNQNSTTKAASLS
jgi:exonuclease III